MTESPAPPLPPNIEGTLELAAWPQPLRRWLVGGVLLIVLGGLLYFALREAPVGEIWRVLAGLHAWQMASLLALNGLIYTLVTARWWFVVRAQRPGIRLLPMIPVRISVFGVSYFTLGPQIGGEPLQVLYLKRRYGLSYASATASVIMDKLFELLGNFVLLSFGLVAIIDTGLFSSATAASRLLLAGLGLLVSWPIMHIMLLYHHVYPIMALLHTFSRGRLQNKTLRFIRASEHLAGQFCQRHPRDMAGGLLVSLLAAACTVSEYALMASFLHIGLPFWKLVTAWTSGWLSFLMPLPGGLGALEASQVSVLSFFGISAATAISLTLIMRGRDLLIGGLGLLLAGRLTRQS